MVQHLALLKEEIKSLKSMQVICQWELFREFEVDVVSEQLKAGDLLIMMSDGVFEGPKHVENYDLWMKTEN